MPDDTRQNSADVKAHNERERAKSSADSQAPLTSEIYSADPDAKVTKISDQTHESPSKESLKSSQESSEPEPPLYIVKGNAVEGMARKLISLSESVRGYWWSATYIEPFDITLVQLSYSKAIHDVREDWLFDGLLYTYVDYDNFKSVNIDDLHFVDQQLGTLSS